MKTKQAFVQDFEQEANERKNLITMTFNIYTDVAEPDTWEGAKLMDSLAYPLREKLRQLYPHKFPTESQIVFSMQQELLPNPMHKEVKQ